MKTFYTHSDLMSSVVCSNPNIPCLPLREPRRIWGIEVAGDWKINAQWSLFGTLSWQDGERKAEGSAEWTRMWSVDLAPLHGSVALGYAPRAWWRNVVTLDWRGGRGRIGDGWPYGQVDPLLLVHLTSSFDVGPGSLDVWYSQPVRRYVHVDPGRSLQSRFVLGAGARSARGNVRTRAP